MKVLLIEDFSNKKKGQTMTVHGNLGGKLIARKVAQEMDKKNENFDYLLKMSVSEIKNKLESLTTDELEFLKEKDDRIGIKKLFA